MFNLVIGGGDVGRRDRRPSRRRRHLLHRLAEASARASPKAAITRQARVQLEMGGKNPLVVLDDADLDRAVMCAIDGAFFGTGQRCTASSRIIVTEGIHDRFVEALAERAKALKVGDALDPSDPDRPGGQRAASSSRTCRYVEDRHARKAARLLTGGEPLKLDKPG